MDQERILPAAYKRVVVNSESTAYFYSGFTDREKREIVSGMDLTEWLLNHLTVLVENGAFAVDKVEIYSGLRKGASERKSIDLFWSGTIDIIPDIGTKIRESKADTMGVYGLYKEIPILIGVDIPKTSVYIMIVNHRPADIDSLEPELDLSGRHRSGWIMKNVKVYI